MRRASILHAVLFSIVILQLQSASGSPITWANPVRVQTISAKAIVETVVGFVQVRLSTTRVVNIEKCAKIKDAEEFASRSKVQPF